MANSENKHKIIQGQAREKCETP